MVKGYCGKILHVNLTNNKILIEEPNENFYRTYMGGSCLGAYFLLKEMDRGIDSFDPRNILVFATGPTTGAPISGATRMNITAKSPLTNAIGDSQAGGFWGAELKFAGFDAIVIKGRAKKPVYLYVHDGELQIKEASHLWGKVTGEAQFLIRKELGDEKVRVAVIGPGGESLVRYASVTNDLKHFNGRTGMGAVMGSKNLKAIAVRGSKDTVKFHDLSLIKELARVGAKKVNSSYNELKDLGTAGTVTVLQAIGGLPTRNYHYGTFKGADKIDGQRIKETIFHKSEACWACAIRCKKAVKVESPFQVDPKYGGPEYESLASLGSYLCIDDLKVIAKANELCNKYTLDTISLGGTVALAMECFERGIINKDDTDGIELTFGNSKALLKVIELIVEKKGIGKLLAEGSLRFAEQTGEEAKKLAIQVKGLELPAHMPRVKASMALAYGSNPFGADHQSHIHDSFISGMLSEEAINLGFSKNTPMYELNFEKVKLWFYTQKIASLMDTLELCQFCFGPMQIYSLADTLKIVRAATGWECNLWELMKVGERRINLLRVFNAREGFTRKDDEIPIRLFELLPDGSNAGKSIDQEIYNCALSEYYLLAGWDKNTGIPTQTKLKELGLDWVTKELEGPCIFS